jgi:hypothetical protein
VFEVGLVTLINCARPYFLSCSSTIHCAWPKPLAHQTPSPYHNTADKMPNNALNINGFTNTVTTNNQ